MNINFGLKVGWTQGGNILAAVVGIRCNAAPRFQKSIP
jgi:hypothetical protein